MLVDESRLASLVLKYNQAEQAACDSGQEIDPEFGFTQFCMTQDLFDTQERVTQAQKFKLLLPRFELQNEEGVLQI